MARVKQTAHKSSQGGLGLQKRKSVASKTIKQEPASQPRSQSQKKKNPSPQLSKPKRRARRGVVALRWVP